MTEPIRCFHGNARPHEPFWAWRARDEMLPESEPELELYGFISEYSWMGDEITPAKFRDDLNTYGKGGPITLRINSGGGEMIAASVIRSILTEYKGRVTARIDGLCASAAVGVALAADVVKIQDSAYMMVHDPGYTLMMGWLDIQTLNDFVDHLKLMKQGILDTYQGRTGLSREKLDKMLKDETWMTGSQAVEFGFADEVITGGKPAAKNASVTDALRNYVNVPPALLNLVDVPAPAAEIPPAPAPAADVELERQAQSLRDELDLYLVKEN